VFVFTIIIIITITRLGHRLRRGQFAEGRRWGCWSLGPKHDGPQRRKREKQESFMPRASHSRAQVGKFAARQQLADAQRASFRDSPQTVSCAGWAETLGQNARSDLPGLRGALLLLVIAIGRASDSP